MGYYVVGAECSRAVGRLREQRRRNVRCRMGVASCGLIVKGGDDALVTPSPVGIVLVWTTPFWGFTSSWARENICSRQTGVGAPLGRRGREPVGGCGFALAEGGNLLLKQNGPLTWARGRRRVLKCRRAPTYGERVENHGGRGCANTGKYKIPALVLRNGSFTGERGMLVIVVLEIATAIAGSAAPSSIAANGDSLPFWRRDVEVTVKRSTPWKCPAHTPIAIATLRELSVGRRRPLVRKGHSFAI